MSTAEDVIDYANPRAGQPLDSRTVFERHGDGSSYTFLPDGLGGAVRALAVIGLCAAVACLFPILILFGAVTADEVGGPSVYAACLALIPLAALWIAVVRSATRPTVLSIRGERVTLFSGAALLRPVKSWALDDVESVSVHIRGVTRRLRLAADLNLHLRGRTTILVIAGRERADLEWVATGLRIELARRVALADVA